MRAILSPIAVGLLLAATGCAQQTEQKTPPAELTPLVSVWQMHTPSGSGPFAYPTTIYDPSLLNDPSLLEDQPHNRGHKGPA